MEKDIIQDMPSNSSSGGGRLSTIFFVVLGLHVLVILGIGAFHLLRGDSSQPQIASAEEQPAQAVESSAALQPSGFAQGCAQPPGDMQSAYPAGAPVNNGAAVMGQPGAVQVAQPAVVQSQVPVQQASQVQAVQSMSAWNQPQQTVQPIAATRVMPMNQNSASAAVPSAQSQTTYTVAKGDTLTRIARKTQSTVQKLREANELKSDMLKIGQKLIVPSASQTEVASHSTQQQVTAPTFAAQPPAAPATPAGTSAPLSPSADNAGYSVHKVAKGETLSKIARTYNTTASNLAKINQITDPTKLRIGAEIKVPAQTARNNADASHTQASTSTTSTAQSVEVSGNNGNEGSAGAAAAFRTPANNQDLAMLRPDSN